MSMRRSLRSLGVMIATTFRASPGPVIFLFGSLIWSSSAFVLLARLDPVLLFLPLLGVPTLIASGQATRVLRKAYEATVERQRLNAVLFNLSTSPGPGKETRIFGL